MKKTLLCVLMSGALLAPAMPGQEAKEHQAKQKARTKQGVASGELTRGEARDLAHDQKKINQGIKKAKADGTVTAEEKSKITAAQTAESNKIERKKNNKRDRN